MLLVAGCVGWFREVLPHEQHETVPSSRSRRRSPPSRAAGGASRGCAEHAHRARLPSRSIRCRPASRAAWPAAWPWPSWPCCYGLIFYRQHLVSDQPAGRRPSTARHDARPRRRLPPFTLTAFAARVGDPPGDLAAGRPALRRDAADVPAAADPARRRHRAAAVDGPALRHARARQPGPERAHRLAWFVASQIAFGDRRRARRRAARRWCRTLAVRAASPCARASRRRALDARRRGGPTR